jgi:hypothetical protein
MESTIKAQNTKIEKQNKIIDNFKNLISDKASAVSLYSIDSYSLTPFPPLPLQIYSTQGSNQTFYYQRSLIHHVNWRFCIIRAFPPSPQVRNFKYILYTRNDFPREKRVVDCGCSRINTTS